MQILIEKPPEWIMTGCLNNFRLDLNTTLWTYEDTIYNPGGFNIPDDLLVHEQTHMIQQAKYAGEGVAYLLDEGHLDEIKIPEQPVVNSADAWWKRYLSDADFRLEQEMQAYGVQYAFFCDKIKDRNKQAKFLVRLADTLASPLYQVAIGQIEARKGIKEVALTLKK